MATPITVPNNTTLIPVNLSSSFKTFTLPVVSTNAGRMLIFKDLYGNAANSTLRLSTIGSDRIELSNISSMVLSNAYGAWTFFNDGITKWFLTNAYLNSLYFVVPAPDYITAGLIYFLDAGNPTSYPGSGTTWTDLMGSGKNMTLFGSPAYSSANGGYITFVPASSQYGQSSSGFGTLLRFSLEVWHYYTGTNTGQFPCLVSEVWPGTTANLNFVFGGYPSASLLQMNYYINAGWQSSAGTSLTTNTWYHLVGIYNGANLQIYINGVLTINTANTQTPNSSTDAFRIMRRWDTGDYWGGRIGIFRMYNRGLDASEVAQNFANGRARFGL
jgi:hypothetical protein